MQLSISPPMWQMYRQTDGIAIAHARWALCCHAQKYMQELLVWLWHIYFYYNFGKCGLILITLSTPRLQKNCQNNRNKETALSQGNRVMLQLLFSVESLRVAKLQKPCSRLQTCRRKTEFNAKWPLKVIQGHVFWTQWKGNWGLSNNKY